MLLMLLDRLLRRQVHRRTRQLRSLGRLQELLWCGMEGVRARLVLQLRMQRRLQGMLLVRQVDRWVHKGQQQVQWWSEVEDRRRRLVRLLGML